MELFADRLINQGAALLGVSIVMPCLDEIQSLDHCIANARAALDEIERVHGLSGEIVIADNGSTDGSQALATRLGARVVPVSRKGYGAAVIGGFDAAWGEFLVMGDCDGSYDFRDAVPMISRLLAGADLVMGSRFKGGIAPGAMPWKNRFIGNPALTGILNLFFQSGISDAHCGLRAIRKAAYARLGLTSDGMEFASEMVIKAALLGLDMREVPAKLLPDLRDRPPHLRPWRDGWRHLRYLFMLSPTWVFGVPALAAFALAAKILLTSMLHRTGLLPGTGHYGDSWVILGGFMVSVGHFAAMMALATHLHGVNQGYRKMGAGLRRFGAWLTLESVLLVGAGLLALSGLGFGYTFWRWAQGSYHALPSVLPVVLAAMTGAVGCQTIMGGFLLAIIAGHKAKIVDRIHALPPLSRDVARDLAA